AAGAGAGGDNDDNGELPAGGRSSVLPARTSIPPHPLPLPQMRRERVNARMRVLQGLVPGAATMTTESFLLEAVHYVRFLLQQVMELSELYTPQNRNREEGEGESGEGQSRAGEGAGCSMEGGGGGKGDVDSELRRDGLRLVHVDRLLPIVGVGGLLDCILVKQQQREEQRQEEEGRNEEREEGEEGMGGEEGEEGEEQEGDMLREGSNSPLSEG
ncbi:unnamed protein product, partial [Closterium sp. NIES-54]